jgi:hypothetical protein
MCGRRISPPAFLSHAKFKQQISDTLLFRFPGAALTFFYSLRDDLLIYLRIS